MSAIYARWELVEPLLFAHDFRDPCAFRDGTTTGSQQRSLDAMRLAHRFDDAAIAEALSLLADTMQTGIARAAALHAMIGDVAARWLVAEGDHWALRVVTRRPGHEIIRWRGVVMLLPPSIVAAGALSRTDGGSLTRVQALPETLAPRSAVAHLHVHLGPMLPFEALWFHLFRTFLQRKCLDCRSEDGISAIKGGAIPEIAHHVDERRPGLRWQWMLELAFAARIWLMNEAGRVPPPSVDAFGRGRVTVERRGRDLLSLWRDDGWRQPARREARRLVQARDEWARQTVREGAAVAGAEVVFLAQCLRRCVHGPSDDHDTRAWRERYARILYQYLRVKVALYRTLVVDPWTKGLRHFLDVVKRDKPYANVINDPGVLEDARLLTTHSEKPLRVEALEIHTLPTSWLRRGRGVRRRRDVSWVLSFVRAKDPADDDPTGARGAEAWRRKSIEVGATCRAIARRIAARPVLLRELRGLSVMDWERNGPVWLFETAFRRLLNASREVAAGHQRLSLTPLRTALHLGEDFDHVLTGLRQIYEPFAWELLGRGDRIGHALALGLDPAAWCARAPWILMRPWDRILDIGFVYWAFEQRELRAEVADLERFRCEARAAIRDVFDDDGGDALEEARDLWLSLPRHPPGHSMRLADDRDPALGACARARRRLRMLTDEPRVGRAALSLSLAVKTEFDLPLLKAAHALVHDRVAKAQVAIEVNPSSNLLVGGFRCLFEQPVFHADGLPLTFHADDPLTFATTLADDYAYAWAGMVVGMGQPPHVATRRLEEAARCSMKYAFTDRRRNPGRTP